MSLKPKRYDRNGIPVFEDPPSRRQLEAARLRACASGLHDWAYAGPAFEKEEERFLFIGERTSVYRCSVCHIVKEE